MNKINLNVIEDAILYKNNEMNITLIKNVENEHKIKYIDI